MTLIHVNVSLLPIKRPDASELLFKGVRTSNEEMVLLLMSGINQKDRRNFLLLFRDDITVHGSSL